MQTKGFSRMGISLRDCKANQICSKGLLSMMYLKEVAYLGDIHTLGAEGTTSTVFSSAWPGN